MNGYPANQSLPVTPEEEAKHYDRFFGPFYFEPYAIEIASRIEENMTGYVLELAAGTGRVTRHIRKRIAPDAKLIASDLDTGMLAVAKEQMKEMSIGWQLIDAGNIPFSGNTFDLLVCAFGYMFLPDKIQAFSEAYRVLRPGGLLLFTTWDTLENNPASHITRSIAETYLDQPIPVSYNIPTSMSDESVVEKQLKISGFSRVVIEKVRLLTSSPTAAEAAAGLTQGGIYEEIRQKNAAHLDEIREKAGHELGKKFGTAPMVAPISALVSRAWK